jgi:casein kinase II subunit alpha
MRKVLGALLYAHSNGIMHRDVKPHNIAVDPRTMKVRLLDWGLAEFYFPKQRCSSHVATRMFKAPELLLDYPYHDYGIDLWALGITFAFILFGKSIIGCGDDDKDQLQNVADLVGGEAIVKYAESLGVKLESHCIDDLMLRGRKGLRQRLEKLRSVPEDAVDLLEKMLTVDHRKRINAMEALKHPFLSEDTT